MKKFIFGMFFILIGLPVIDSATALLSNETQLLSYKIAKKIYIIKKELQQLGNEQEQSSGNPIGFQTSCCGFEIEPNQTYEQEQEYKKRSSY